MFLSLIDQAIGVTSQRTTSSALLLTFVTMIFVGALVPEYLTTPEIPVGPDGHSQLSLELAMNRVYCGVTSGLSEFNHANGDVGRTELRQVIKDNREILEIPMRSIIPRYFGSYAGYCPAVTTSFINNENTLMFLYVGLLRADKDISLGEMSTVLFSARIVIVSLFAFAMIRIGFSPIITAIVFGAGLFTNQAATTNLAEPTAEFNFSLYPFLFCAVALFVAFCTLLISYGAHRRVGYALLWSFILGVVGAGIANLRTSYAPVVLVLFAGFVVVAAVDILRSNHAARRKVAALSVAAFIAFMTGQASFNRYFVEPIASQNTPYNVAYHVVAHPLVLALAVPDNPLARSEGIQWDDAAGIEIARRLDSKVNYLGPGYERALFAYYAQLWILHTSEMEDVYRKKLLLAGKYGIDFLYKSAGRLKRIILWPLRLIPNGLALLFAYGGLLVVIGVMLIRGAASDRSFLLMGMTLAATMLHLESAIILPYFYVNLNNSLMFWYYLLGALLYQIAGVAVVRAFKSSMRILQDHRLLKAHQ